MIWKKNSSSWLMDRLEPPKGKIKMVLDTDTYNEVDDQFALCYGLLSPERLEVEAIYAAPFYNARSCSPEDGMNKSYNEILRLLSMMKLNTEDFVFKGATSYLPDGQTPVDSPAAQDLIRRARLQPANEPLYVVAIAAITNIASALLMAPDIIEKIVVVWLGGHPFSYPHTHEFNLEQDIPAARILFDSGVPLIIIPCMGVSSHLLTSVPEMEAHLKEKNELCDTLIELFKAYETNHFAWSKEIWDISTIGYLINPDWVPTALMHSPLITDDCHWATDSRRHMIRVAYFIFRNPIFKDMYQKLSEATF